MQPPLFHITLIDDDPNFLKILALSLENIFNISTFSSPREGLNFIKTKSTDGVFLDLHMEDTDGFSICKEIRGINRELPVFFLTSDSDIKSIGEGFEIGGTDYFLKSISTAELRTRVKARIQKYSKPLLQFGDITMDLKAQRVFIRDGEITFTPKCYEILKVFMERPNQILRKSDLLELLWKDVHVDANNIDTHMFHMRKKLKESSAIIQTRKALGYILTSTNVSKR